MKRIALLIALVMTFSVSADFFPEEKKKKSKADIAYEKYQKSVQERIKNSKTITEACVTNLEKYRALAQKYADIPEDKRTALENLKFDHLKHEIQSLVDYCFPEETDTKKEKDT